VSALGTYTARNLSPSAQAEIRDHLFQELDREVAPLLELLGPDTLLIPEVYGGKRPRLRGWAELTHEALRADANHYYYRVLADAVFERGNLGVLLGEASGRLCAVDLDREEAVEPWLRKNPRLEETFRSTGSGRGCQFWVRIAEGSYYVPRVLKISVTEHLAARYGGVPRNPDTGTFDIGEWRGGQKSTIWGRHPSGRAYEILVRAKPVELTMEELELPTGWRLRFIRPTEFGPWDAADDETTEAGRIRAADRRVANSRWRGGGGSH
jgi:hypothetical protein